MPIIIPNYNKNFINNSRKHLYNLEHKTNDDCSTDISSNIYNIKNSEKIISNLNRNNNVNKENKYFVKNKLYKDKSYNIVLKKIYTQKNINSKSCRNLETDLSVKKNKHDKIIFSIFNNVYYPKNNYDLEIFDFKTENSDNFTSQKISNKEEEKNNVNINIDIMNQLKELNTKLKNRLDKFEEEQKNNQKNINYLLKKANKSNKSQESNNGEKNKDNIKNNQKKNENIKVKPLGLYHRLAGGYNAQNFNVNRNMIIKDSTDN